MNQYRAHYRWVAVAIAVMEACSDGGLKLVRLESGKIDRLDMASLSGSLHRKPDVKNGCLRPDGACRGIRYVAPGWFVVVVGENGDGAGE